MKALTIRQPWASLIAAGVKTIETRSWTTGYRGPLLIHAGKVREYFTRVAYVDNLGSRNETQPPGFILPDRTEIPDPGIESFPLGVVVATADLVDVVPVNDYWWCEVGSWADSEEDEEYLRSIGWGQDGVNGGGWFAIEQRPLGDFTPGRYGWLLDNVRPLAAPIPCKGMQGLWRPNDALLAAVEVPA